MLNMAVNPRLAGTSERRQDAPGQKPFLKLFSLTQVEQQNCRPTEGMHMVYTVMHRKPRQAGGRARACCTCYPPPPPASSLYSQGGGQTLAFIPAGVRIRACRMSDREIIPTILSASFTTTSRWTCQ